jgi:hypothetical protein
VFALRPTDARCWRLDGEYLARAMFPCVVGGTGPLVRHQEQRSLVRTPQHASEAAAVEVDRLQHLATLANADAALVGDVPVPDGVFGVEADAVGRTAG